jgi:hypothetical protein
MGNFSERLDLKHDLMIVPRVLRHKRSYENFVTSDEKVKLPPAYPKEIWNATLGRSTLFPYLFTSATQHGLLPPVIVSVAFGFVSGAIANFLFLRIMWETYQQDHEAFERDLPWTGEGGSMANVGKFVFCC